MVLRPLGPLDRPIVVGRVRATQNARRDRRGPTVQKNAYGPEGEQWMNTSLGKAKSQVGAAV